MRGKRRSLYRTTQPRILQVCAVDFTAYHLLRPLLLATRDAGYATEFACSDGPGADALRKEGFIHRPLPIVRSGPMYRNVVAVTALATSLHRSPVDIVHTHTPIGGLIGRTGAAVARTPIIVHTFHGLAYGGAGVRASERVFVQLERILARTTDQFFSQGTADAERAVRMGIARSDRMLVIGNGIDLSRFASDPDVGMAVRAELGIPRDAVVAVCVARLIREKGVLDLAAAALRCADIPRLVFLVVGDALPSDRDAVTEELAAHPVARELGLRWLRVGYRSDVDRMLKAADFFVLPSYREGLPRSLIEAMACGLPAVMTDIPAGRELISNGETGILVPPGDITALVNAVRQVALDPAHRRVMGEAARARAGERHSETAVLERELRAFSTLLAR